MKKGCMNQCNKGKVLLILIKKLAFYLGNIIKAYAVLFEVNEENNETPSGNVARPKPPVCIT